MGRDGLQAGRFQIGLKLSGSNAVEQAVFVTGRFHTGIAHSGQRLEDFGMVLRIAFGRADEFAVVIQLDPDFFLDRDRPGTTDRRHEQGGGQ